LILACSQRKRCAANRLPALERYDGPAFKVVRRFLRQHPDEKLHLGIQILSAEFGLIPSKLIVIYFSKPIPLQYGVQAQSCAT
jgi:hypothetical protein